MRRMISAIMILVVFISFQFGKMIVYVYCKWQSEVIQQKAACDCERHLVSIYSQAGIAGNNFVHVVSPGLIREFPPEPIITGLTGLQPAGKNFPPDRDVPLKTRFLSAFFRPPVA
jgi:hypothetical protein